MTPHEAPGTPANAFPGGAMTPSNIIPHTPFDTRPGTPGQQIPQTPLLGGVTPAAPPAYQYHDMIDGGDESCACAAVPNALVKGMLATPPSAPGAYPVYATAARGSAASRPAAPRMPLRWGGFPEPNKVVQPMHVAGRAAHNQSPVAAVNAVLAAPTPNNKIQPQLQNLPRFQPPDFEGAGSLWSELGPFPPLSFVEYKSRSSNQWILAKVESYNTETQSYRLDVQPYAPADRVRARRPMKRAGAQVEDTEMTPVALRIETEKAAQNSHTPVVCVQRSPQEEVELLRKRVAELEEENQRLQVQVAQETELKERYRQETANTQRASLDHFPSIQAVIFDFDGTLTVREEIPGWRIFPERGGFGRQGPDNSWLRERGFGGQDRISHLREMLCDLKRLGVQNRIVSFADRDVIERATALLELRSLFVDIAGFQEVGSWEFILVAACKFLGNSAKFEFTNITYASQS
eukprot:g1796.t1